MTKKRADPTVGRPKSGRQPSRALEGETPGRASRAPATYSHKAALAVIALAACVVGLANDFVYDDIPLILHDNRFTNFDNWGAFFTSSYWQPPNVPDLYRPIASMTMAVEFVVGGGSPLVFRVVSYLLYCAATLAVFGLARRVLEPRLAFATAALFAAHPVHVEAVALGANQGELLVAILSCYAASFYIDRRRTTGRLSKRDWAVLASLYVVASLTKENGFVLPGLLLACELVIADDKSTLGDRLRNTWGGFAILAVVGLVLVAIRSLVLGNVVGAFTANALQGLGLGGRLLTMLKVVPIWARLLVWPAHLKMDYSPDEVIASTSFGPAEAAGLVLLVMVVVIAVRSRRVAPTVAFGLAWCGVALFPVSNIVPTSITVAERTLFLPSVGFLIACVGLVGLVLRWPALRRFRPPPETVAAYGCCLLVVLGVARSAQRETTWRNSASFWRTAAVDAPKSKRVRSARGRAVLELTQEFEPAIASAANPAGVRDTLAYLLLAMNADSAAVVQLRTSLALDSTQDEVRVELISALLAMGDYDSAAKWAAYESPAGAPGERRSMLQILRQLTDSARRAGARPGSIRVSTPYRQR